MTHAARSSARTTSLRTAVAIVVLALASLAMGAAPAAAAPVAGTCTVYASPTGNDAAAGTAAAPFRTFKRLADALAPGSVGCLRAGTYAPPPGVDGVTLNKGGTTAAPATLRSAPGEAATVEGRIVLALGAHDLVIAGLRLNGISATNSEASSLTVDADRVSLIGNDITAPTRICISGGSARQVTGLLIEGNRIHHCGDGAPRARQEHGVYLQQTRGAIVRHNVIDHNNTRGLNLYYDADNTIIENNVIDANAEGINLGAKLVKSDPPVAYRSEGNIVRNNLITNSTHLAIESYYDEVAPVGDLGNVIGANCIFGTSRDQLMNKLEGFRYEASNAWVDPQYNGQPVGDYRLKATSPCIGKGLRASVTPVRVRSITTTGATFDAALNPHRMTTSYFVRVRPCSDSTCTSVGAWVSTAAAQTVGVVDVAVARTVSGLTRGRTYQYQWAAHQALLPASNAAALVTTTPVAFRTAP